MDASEFSLSMINKISSMSQREVDYIDAIHLTNFIIALPSVDIFSHQFGSTEQHTLEVGVFIIVLYLYQHQFTLGILGKHIDTVILVILILLIAFTF